jgi:DNA-directed RNA polymerase specialized sigma24 family protein
MASERSPRQLLRKVEGRETFPLIALEALRQLRATLDEAEAEAILRARELGATVEDVADALGITRQGVHYKLKQLERSSPGDPEVEDVTVTLPDADARDPT